MRQSMRDRFESVQSGVSHGYRNAERAVARNPAPSLLIGFGVGFGLGLVLTTILGQREETWSEWADRRAHEGMRHAHEGMRHAHDSARHVHDAAKHWPDSLHHLADSIRTLPDAIARHLPSSLMGR